MSTARVVLKSLSEYESEYKKFIKYKQGIFDAVIDKAFTHETRVLNLEAIQTDTKKLAEDIFQEMAQLTTEVRDQYYKQALAFNQIAIDIAEVLLEFAVEKRLKNDKITGVEPISFAFNYEKLSKPLTTSQIFRRLELAQLKFHAINLFPTTANEMFVNCDDLQSLSLEAYLFVSHGDDQYKESGLDESGDQKCQAFSKKVRAKITQVRTNFYARQSPAIQTSPSEEKEKLKVDTASSANIN